MKTIVKRSEWLRGDGGGFLLNYKGKKCCLGFRALGLGMTEAQILGHRDPLSFGHGEFGWQKWMQEAVRINDGLGMTSDIREELLAEIFKEAGEEIEFVD